METSAPFTQPASAGFFMPEIRQGFNLNASFPLPLIVTPNDDMSIWTLTAPFCFWSGGVAGRGVKIFIPIGFKTDFASTHGITSPIGSYGFAAVCHDYLYVNKGVVQTEKGGYTNFSREQCDVVFLELMKASNVLELTREEFYFAVRAFGISHWGRVIK